MKRALVAGVVLSFGLLVGWGAKRARSAAASWPASRLSQIEAMPPPGFHRRLFIDAGHGAPGNTGNQSSYCRSEQDFTRELAGDVKARLEHSGHFSVELSREGDALPSYEARVSRARTSGADLFLSLHSDVRGRREAWQPSEAQTCWRSREAPGFALLVAEREPSAAPLARRLAARMSQAGFLAYDGAEYGPVYAADETPGVFADRHAAHARLYVLWESSMPSLIVETHNALDDREAARWAEPETRAAFTAALVAALLDLGQR